MSSKLRTLLIDDNSSDRELVQRVLAQRVPGTLVVPIVDAASCARALAAGDFNLVITEYRLGWTDGLSVLRSVRLRKPDCPVIILTASGSEEVAVEAMKAGLDDYIRKSGDYIERLHNAIHSALTGGEHRPACREMVKRLQTVMENSLDGVSLIDADGTNIYRSPSVDRLLGYSDYESVGSNGFDFIHPDDLETTRNLFGKLIQKPGQRAMATLRCRRKDGSWVWLECIATNHLADPAIRAVICNYRDVTERKQAEARLRESEERFREFFENASISLIVLDDDGHYVEVNHEAEELTGYSKDELLRMKLPALTAPALRDKVRSVFTEDARNRKVEGEVQILRKDHTVVPVHYSASPVGSSRYLVSFRDLSKEKIAEEAARQATEFAQAVITSVEEGIVVHHRDEYYTVWNKYMEQLTGYTGEEMKGRSSSGCFPLPSSAQRSGTSGESTARRNRFPSRYSL